MKAKRPEIVEVQEPGSKGSVAHGYGMTRMVRDFVEGGEDRAEKNNEYPINVADDAKFCERVAFFNRVGFRGNEKRSPLKNCLSVTGRSRPPSDICSG